MLGSYPSPGGGRRAAGFRHRSRARRASRRRRLEGAEGRFRRAVPRQVSEDDLAAFSPRVIGHAQTLSAGGEEHCNASRAPAEALRRNLFFVKEIREDILTDAARDGIKHNQRSLCAQSWRCRRPFGLKRLSRSIADRLNRTGSRYNCGGASEGTGAFSGTVEPPAERRSGKHGVPSSCGCCLGRFLALGRFLPQREGNCGSPSCLVCSTSAD